MNVSGWGSVPITGRELECFWVVSSGFSQHRSFPLSPCSPQTDIFTSAVSLHCIAESISCGCLNSLTFFLWLGLCEPVPYTETWWVIRAIIRIETYIKPNLAKCQQTLHFSFHPFSVRLDRWVHVYQRLLELMSPSPLLHKHFKMSKWLPWSVAKLVAKLLEQLFFNQLKVGEIKISH